MQRLSQDEGVNLAGIKRIIELTNQVEALQARIKELNEELAQLRASQRRDVAVVPKSTALVVWAAAPGALIVGKFVLRPKGSCLRSTQHSQKR